MARARPFSLGGVFFARVWRAEGGHGAAFSQRYGW